MSDPLTSFVDAMRAAGVAPANDSDITPDDKWHPVQLADDRPKKKTGYYRLKLDGDFAVGNFGSHRIGETHNWHSKQNGRDYTDEERAEFKARIDAERAAKEEERINNERKAAHDAKIIWDGAEYAKPDHPYLVKKGIKPHNFKQHDGKLLIPMWADKKFQAYQTIDEDGDKLYLPGARKKGCSCPLIEKGEPLDVILLAEGAATAATVREIIGLPTVICFDAGNLLAVAEDLRKKYPQSKIVFCADNDAHQRLKPTDAERVYVGPDSPLNTGIRKAEQAAVKVGFARVVYPVFNQNETLSDFNDLAVKEGEDAVRAKIDEAMAAPMPEPPKQKKLVKAKAGHKPLAGWEEMLIPKDYTVKDAPDGTKQKEIISLRENSINYKLIICNHPRLHKCFAYDEFHLCTMVVSPLPHSEDALKDFQHHPLSETDIRNTDYFLQKLGNLALKGSKEKTLDGIEECGLQNAFHPARDYLSSLVWDGTPRLDNWLITYIRCKDNPAYLRAIGCKWLVGGVKRLMEPGCQMDNILILEGLQDAGKSRTFRTLSRFGPPESCHEYFMDTFNISNAEDTDELMKLAGAVIVEIQEMSGFTKKDDDAMKKFISTTHDTYRAPYGRRPQKWPRQFLLGGTLNPKDGIFKDSTGLKRYWVAETGDVIDLAGLERDREQLWAEAVHRYRQGESLVLSDEMKVMARQAAEERRIVHVMTDEVVAAAKYKKFFTTKEIMQAMGIALKLDQKSQSETFTINDILRVQGFRRCKKSKGGHSVWGWEPPKHTPVQEELYNEPETEIDF